MNRQERAGLAGVATTNVIGWTALITCLVGGFNAPLWAIIAAWALAYFVGTRVQNFVLSEGDDETV